jgi:hypothetical protein
MLPFTFSPFTSSSSSAVSDSESTSAMMIPFASVTWMSNEVDRDAEVCPDAGAAEEATLAEELGIGGTGGAGDTVCDEPSLSLYTEIEDRDACGRRRAGGCSDEVDDERLECE